MYSNNNYNSNLYGNINDDTIDVGIFEPQEDINIFPEGTYEFSVKEVKKRLSASSRKMMVVTLEIQHPETKGKSSINEFFILEEAHRWKIGKFADCIGHPEIYQKSGKIIPSDIINSKGYAEFKRDELISGDESKKYFKIKTFLTKQMLERKKSESVKKESEIVHDQTFNDEIPF